MGECYGTYYYLEHNQDRVKRTIAAMCIDSPAGLQHLAGTEYTWIMNPHSAHSYVDALVLRIAEEYYPSVGRPWHAIEHRSSTDNYLGDPSIGIPTVMQRGGYGVLAHHNSADVPTTVDPKSLRDMMVTNAAFTYFIASAGPAEKRWMAELALTNGYQRLASASEKILDQIAAGEGNQLSRLAYQGRERINYSLALETQAVKSAFDLQESVAGLAAFAKQQTDRLDQAVRARATTLGMDTIPPYAPPSNAEAAKIVVKRKRIGTITLDDLGREQREGYPAAGFWNPQVSALYWCDGKRNLAEVIRLTELEVGPQDFDWVGYFKFLQKRGYVDFVTAN